MTTVVIYENGSALSVPLASSIQGVADAHTIVAVSLDDALEICTRERAHVLVASAGATPAAQAEHIGASPAVAATSVVLVADDVDAGLLRVAMRAGVADVVSRADVGTDLAEAVRRGIRRAESLRVPAAGTSSPEPAIRPRASLVTVFGTKGGVGKTVLATNLGVSLAMTGARTVLVDLDLEFGDVAIMLGLEPTHTIVDAVAAFDRLDGDMLGACLVRHSSGLQTLLAPVRPEDAEGIGAGRVAKVLDLLEDSFDYVVVDTPPTFSDTVLMALDRSDEIYLMTMMDVASIKNTRVSLQKLTQLGYDASRVRVVLNRADSKVLLEPGEVTAALGAPIECRIPSDRIIPRSVNRGVPVTVDAASTPAGRVMTTLARDVVKRARMRKEAADHVATGSPVGR